MAEEKYKLNEKYRGVYGRDVVLPLARCTFLNLKEPNTKFNPPKYGLTLLTPKENNPEEKLLKDVQNMAKEMFAQLTEHLHQIDTKEKKTKLSLADYRNEFKIRMKYPLFRDGDTLEKYDGHVGNWVIVAKSGDITQVKFLDGRTPNDFAAGQLVRAQVTPYLGPDGFSYQLRVLRLIKDDGVRLAGGGPVDMLSQLDEAVEAVKVRESAEASFDAAVAQATSSEAAVEPSGLDVL